MVVGSDETFHYGDLGEKHRLKRGVEATVFALFVASMAAAGLARYAALRCVEALKN